MDLIPELFDIVFGYLDDIRDRKALLFTCKKYYRQYARLMIDVKYAIFYVISNDWGYPIYNFKGICDDVVICKKYIKGELMKHLITTPAFNKMNKENNYTMVESRDKINICSFNSYVGRGYVVEEMKINKIGGILYKN